MCMKFEAWGVSYGMEMERFKPLKVLTTQGTKKKFITDNPKHTIDNMEKHVENEHATDLAWYKLEVATTKGFRDGRKKAKFLKRINIKLI